MTYLGWSDLFWFQAFPAYYEGFLILFMGIRSVGGKQDSYSILNGILRGY